jgi:hypothetical protein
MRAAVAALEDPAIELPHHDEHQPDGQHDEEPDLEGCDPDRENEAHHAHEQPAEHQHEDDGQAEEEEQREQGQRDDRQNAEQR